MANKDKEEKELRCPKDGFGYEEEKELHIPDHWADPGEKKGETNYETRY